MTTKCIGHLFDIMLARAMPALVSSCVRHLRKGRGGRRRRRRGADASAAARGGARGGTSGALVAPADLRVHVLTIPAHGHYATVRDLTAALARRGHAVTFAMCEQSRPAFDFDADELTALGIEFLSLGPPCRGC
jgi:hypothetical protein